MAHKFWENQADIVIDDFKELIHIEDHFIKKEHDLELVVLSWHNVIGQLDEEIIPAQMKHLHKFNQEIAEEIEEIHNLITQDETREIHLKKEEEKILKKVSKGKHRAWRIIEKKEKESIRLHISEINKLHSKFKDLANLMKESKLIKAINEDTSSEKAVEEYKNKEEYYFLHIYKCARAYEHILKGLLAKEKSLVN
jgi:hypothetical protein